MKNVGELMTAGRVRGRKGQAYPVSMLTGEPLQGAAALLSPSAAAGQVYGRSADKAVTGMSGQKLGYGAMGSAVAATVREKVVVRTPVKAKPCETEPGKKTAPEPVAGALRTGERSGVEAAVEPVSAHGMFVQPSAADGVYVDADAIQGSDAMKKALQQMAEAPAKGEQVFAARPSRPPRSSEPAPRGGAAIERRAAKGDTSKREMQERLEEMTQRLMKVPGARSALLRRSAVGAAVLKPEPPEVETHGTEINPKYLENILTEVQFQELLEFWKKGS